MKPIEKIIFATGVLCMLGCGQPEPKYTLRMEAGRTVLVSPTNKKTEVRKIIYHGKEIFEVITSEADLYFYKDKKGHLRDADTGIELRSKYLDE